MGQPWKWCILLEAKLGSAAKTGVVYSICRLLSSSIIQDGTRGRSTYSKVHIIKAIAAACYTRTVSGTVQGLCILQSARAVMTLMQRALDLVFGDVFGMGEI